MKKFLVLILSSFLVLAACGQEEHKDKDNKTETNKKAEKKDKQKKADNKKEKNEEKSATEKSTNQNETDNNQSQNSQPQSPQQNQEQTSNQQTSNQQSNHYLTKSQMQHRLKSGQSVDGMVDTDGDTWYQAPGNGDVVGYTKPDGTVCTVGGCRTPEELQPQQDKSNNEESEGHEEKQRSDSQDNNPDQKQ
ncbi:MULTISPECIES: hypothetical protein [Staphylococcus]|uniref:Lipoprotein n=1 Tax=Staphylococcus argensis TaxID=1607738 RepID=A0A2K4FDU2_9STAP|nr:MULTISPECIES: hypothetical protein [Staphylococcus]MCY1566807.1 hypothetical protein [Staphylococcus pettenkoferi]MCY1608076.1 hypothetical protein [Staphylococcus pettenkoferi]MCY6991238.1 hypothetical protein [Staphylococcus argensis]OFK74627.1 hypothetical protein HMPREF2802_06315 [Staphylococcus sp. HMSC071G07]POA09453.1 hypothetical protein CD039_01445 [Staphylococcus argensis]